MEFGIFSQMHVPPWDDEHSRYLRELEVSLAVEAAGFKYDWSPEHHFLKNYSHQPAPEVYLSWVAARTKRIHVGTAIVNLTAAVNHPARVAERIAVMDHLSEGRVEFGTGRGSSSAEWAGFAIPSAAETKPMWRESLEQIPRMWRDEPYAFEGKYFRMPERLKAGLAVGGRQIGAPEEIVRVIEMYEALGVDQLIYAPLTLTLDQRYVLESIETFGTHVLPKFDTDPVHRTTRQREAALKAQAA